MGESESPDIEKSKIKPSWMAAVTRRAMKISYKIIKWPVVLFLIYLLATVPFYFVDDYYVIGNEEEIHKNNFYRLMKLEATKNDFAKELMKSATKGNLILKLDENRASAIKNYPKYLVRKNCCDVILEIKYYSLQGGIGRKIAVIDKLAVFIYSIFGKQMYIYSISYNDGTGNLYYSYGKNSILNRPGNNKIRAYYTADGSGPIEFRRNNRPATVKNYKRKEDG